MVVYNPNGPDFEFEGVKLGEINHGEVGTLQVFQTKSGKYIASQSHEVMRPNKDWIRADILDTPEDLLKWLGSSKSAKALAREIGLSTTQVIE